MIFESELVAGTDKQHCSGMNNYCKNWNDFLTQGLCWIQIFGGEQLIC
jgi:hypothetical protein